MRFELITAKSTDLGSPARREPGGREPLTIGVVQIGWQADPAAHLAALSEGVHRAADVGAQVVCLQELTLSPYFAATEQLARDAAALAENLADGPTFQMARQLAASSGAIIHASLFEAADDGRLGYNTAICVDPRGQLLARTRKTHSPGFPGYHEDLCFRHGDSGFPVVEAAG
ncbi:MAG: nitrilase-related carbon-nitrogen hydrolase, partial [Streptosporangiaceae bacterium]